MLSSTPDVFISKTRMLKIVAPELIFSCLKNMPQLMIHKQELENCLNKDVKSFLTLDMVDQWAATQGLVCKDKGIKSYTLQNTSLDDIVYPIPVSTDYFLASTASDKVKLNPCKNVIVIGIPMYDHLEELISLKDKEYENFARKYKLVERYENIVLFIPQPFIQDYPYNEKLIKDSLEAFKGESVLVIIKVHPRQKCSEFQQYKILLEELNIKCIVISKGDFNQVALISDIGISRTSTALQTLIYFNKKIVAYLDNYPSDIVERLSYLNNEYIYKCNSQKSYIKTLQLLLKGVSKEENKILNKEKEKYLEQTIGYFDGLSSQRAYNEITKL
jgi:hypothetical protein